MMEPPAAASGFRARLRSLFSVDGVPHRDAPAATPPTHLRECLIIVARLLAERPVSVDTFAGLPMENGQISLQNFSRACERVGLQTLVTKRGFDDLSPAVLPCIVLAKPNRALVLLKLDPETDSCSLIDPAGPLQPKSISRAEMRNLYGGVVVLVTPKEVQATDLLGLHGPRTEQRQHWFWGTVKTFWPSYTHVAVASFVVNMLALATPLFTMNVYDRVVPNASFTTLWSLAIGIGLVLFFDFLLKTIRSEVVDVIGKKADMVLAARIFEHMQGLFLAVRPGSAGSLASQIREFETVREFFTSSTVTSLVDLAFIFIFVSVLFMVSGPLAWVAVGAVVLCLIITLLVQKPLGLAINSAQRESALRHSILIEALTSLETIKTLGAESRMQSQWERAILATARSGTAARHWSSLALHLTSVVQQFVTIIMVVWGVYLITDGALTTGALIASTILAGRAIGPLAGISATLTRIQQTRTALLGIDKLMQLPHEVHSGRNFVSRPITQGAVTFQNVSFTYPHSSVPALDQFNFQINGGEKIGVIGRIGCGKTTLGRLMAGLYIPKEGTILVDGVDARQYHVAELRRGIGLVVQDPELFMGTLKENIIFGLPEASDEDMLAAARLAGVDEFADQHPMGYDMPIGERGRTLSGGQRQAVAIARILIRKPRILYLDEPSSAMDTASEARLLARLETIAKTGVTLIISTHRHSLLRIVDRLMVIERGRLFADGPKDMVLAKLQQQAALASQAQVRAAE